MQILKLLREKALKGNKKLNKRRRKGIRTCDDGTDPSAGAFEESEDDLGDGLVDSQSAGQESAPMTGPVSATPFGGLLPHAGFFPRAALLLPLLLPASEPSTAADSGGTSSDLRGERPEDSGEAIAVDRAGDIDREEGEEVVAGAASDSPPRTMCDHGASDISQDLP